MIIVFVNRSHMNEIMLVTYGPRRENLSLVFSKNKGLDQPDPSVQSDHCLCYSLIRKYNSQNELSSPIAANFCPTIYLA